MYTVFYACITLLRLAGMAQPVVSAGLLVLLFTVSLIRVRGARWVFAALAWIDLTCLLPLQVLLWSAQGWSSIHTAWLPPDHLLPNLCWRFLLFGLSLGVAAGLLRGRRMPDWFLPVSGIWARRLVAAGTVMGLVGAVWGEYLEWLLARPAGAIVPPELLVGGAVVALYCAPLCDVLSRGWTRQAVLPAR